MHGGVILFRGTGADALRYVESDRSRADDYYLSDGAGLCYTVLDATGEALSVRALATDEYNGWADWINPDTGESMGKPRHAGPDRLGSPRFAEMTINNSKSLSIAAALHPEVSEALDRAQQDALSEIQRWLARHSVSRVGPRGKQEVVPVERIQVVGITHRTSRAGDPHRHIHMQLGTRVWAADAWRALDTGAIFKQQGAIRALGTAVIAAHPELAEVLDRHGLTLNPVTGEVVELEPFNTLMSKRGEQVHKNLARLESEWEAKHPGETMGPVVSSRLTAQAWAYERPAKKPTTLREEEAWLTELRETGYDPDHLARQPMRAPVHLDDLSVQQIASRALDRCAANESAWTRHTVQEHATRIISEAGVRASGEELRNLITVATALALEDCFSVLPPGAPAPEHVAHLTSLKVVQVETELRDLITARTSQREPSHPDVREHAVALGQRLDPGQMVAAAAVASSDPLVIVEGVAGAGKTTMLATAIRATEAQGRRAWMVAPTKRAADVAHQELGVPAESVAALVHAHGWRWNSDGVWSRLGMGDTDPITGAIYNGPPRDAQLRKGDRIVVDEAGMLGQDTALALFTVAAETGATLALVGDRAQLAAVGRGGVLDIAAQLRGRTFDMAEVHRFTNSTYAETTVQMRDRRDPAQVFEQLQQLGLIRLHTDADEMRAHIATSAHDGEAVTVASNEEAAKLNDRIRDERISQGKIDDTRTATGSDGLNIGRGDLIQTRKNNTELSVANRQQWIVQHIERDGALWVCEAHSDRKREHSTHLPAEYVREHTHLSYAVTAYGVQGVTVPASHTILSEGMSGSAVYVGMTRGRNENTLHVIADDIAQARQQFVDAMERDRTDRGLTDATERATEAVHGLVANGPTKFVSDEIAVLLAHAAQSEASVARWQRAATNLNELHHQEAADRQAARESEQAAKRHAERVRAEVAAPLSVAATAALTEWQLAEAAEQATGDLARAALWFGKRRIRDEHESARTQANEARQQLTGEWGDTPKRNEPVDAWAERVTRPRIENDPRVINAEQAHQAARDALLSRPERAQTARLAVFGCVFGAEQILRNRAAYLSTNPLQRATNAAQTAKQARAEVELLRSLSPDEAVVRIEQTRVAEAASEAQRAEQRRAALHDPSESRALPGQTPLDRRRGL